MLGYEVFKTDNLKDNITIRLKSKALELKGSVKKSSLVTAQGDTLDYAASHSRQRTTGLLETSYRIFPI